MEKIKCRRCIIGTRSIVCIKDDNGKKIAEIYKQFDGYPEGWGAELQEFINSGKMVNGIGADQNVFNGIGCFAAQLIAKFKDGAGGIYLETPTRDYVRKTKYLEIYNAEYYYEIQYLDGKFHLNCWDCYSNQQVFIPNLNKS